MNEQYIAYIEELINGASVNIAATNARLEEIERMQEEADLPGTISEEAIDLEQQLIAFTAEKEMGEKLFAKYVELHPWKNSDDHLKDLAQALALDIQMEIDDHDIGSNTLTLDYLIRRGVQNDLIQAIDVYRTLEDNRTNP